MNHAHPFFPGVTSTACSICGRSRGDSSHLPNRTPYRGYTILWQPFTGEFRVTAESHHVAWAPTLEHAKREIDELHENETRPSMPRRASMASSLHDDDPD